MDTRPHAFVVMPFGTKTDATGQEIQFNEVHKRLIRPALEKAGGCPWRWVTGSAGRSRVPAPSRLIWGEPAIKVSS